jgi:hypothetical protein
MRIAIVILAACGGSSSPTPSNDAGDDATPLTCGNGALEGEEVCDAPIACNELGATWSGGTAACRADCSGWDVAACTRADATRWETIEPATRDARWMTARCNDGTPFDVDVRLAATPSKQWVIYLQGGGFCDDNAHSCADREARLVTTTPRTDRQLAVLPTGGVTSQNPSVNPLATANHVRANYCSSDFWSGATTDRRPTLGDRQAGWYFSGRAHVRAMLDVLEERYGLDDADPETQVLFTGSSAGGFGAHFNIAAVGEALPATTARGDLRLFVDAGWMHDWIDPDPAPPAYFFGEATVPDAEVWQRARTFWGGTFDPACEAAVAEPARCLYGAVWYAHVTVPVLVNQSSFDAVFTGEHRIPDPPNATAAAWRAGVEASMASIAWLFSGDLSYHVLTTTDAGLTRGPAGSTLADVLGRFWADGAPERVEF